MSKQKKSDSGEFKSGKLYLKRSEVWAVDYGSEEYLIVYVKDTSFKVQADNLVLVGATSDESNG